MNDAPVINTLEITLEKLVYGGEALGRMPDGRAIFVAYGLPGERVLVQVVEEKRGFARANLVEVLEPSQERITPICKHFSICGGCHYQHMSYDTQLRIKTEILRDQLIRIGGLENPRINNIVPSPKQWNYRNSLQFRINVDGKLGYKKWRSAEVVPIVECHLPEETLNGLWPQLEIDPQPELERAGLRLGAADAAMLILESNSDEAAEIKIDIPVAVVHLGPTTVQVLADTSILMMDILERSFQVSARSFFQVNTGMAEKLVTHLLETLPLNADTTLVDVYCGVGLFSAFLAPRVGYLVGVEASPSACDDFVVNLAEFNNVSIYQDTAERALAALDEPADIIVVDPPRAGLTRPVMDAILDQHKPAVLAYVSCDPATLGRDAKRLVAGGYRLMHATPFDVFPQTFHIESISYWERF